MKNTKMTKLSNVLELIKDIEEFDIETIDNRLYITSTDTDILTVLENLVNFNVADDYMSGKTRYMKISINL